jgi:hypothetical protein
LVKVKHVREFVCGAAAVAALAVAAGCAELSGPSPLPATEPGSFGVLDSAYDRTKWRWVKNQDGRPLLAHTEVQKCFVDPQPGQDFNDPDFKLKRERKTIGKTQYDVLNVFQDRDFWIAVYQREGSQTPLLGVYADGRCRAEAERILQAYDTK